PCPRKGVRRMLFGVPPLVKAFFRPVTTRLSKPIRQALPLMVLALLLAPHRRCLKTLSGLVLGHREHAGTISRRLRNRRWKTRDWYTDLYGQLLDDTNGWERPLTGARRQWILVIDTTYHGTNAQGMENLIYLRRRRKSSRGTSAQHAFVLGLIFTDK